MSEHNRSKRAAMIFPFMCWLIIKKCSCVFFFVSTLVCFNTISYLYCQMFAVVATLFGRQPTTSQLHAPFSIFLCYLPLSNIGFWCSSNTSKYFLYRDVGFLCMIHLWFLKLQWSIERFKRESCSKDPREQHVPFLKLYILEHRKV